METNRIEHKEKLTPDIDIEKEVVAFLNYHEGGLLYIGIDKHGKTLGVADADSDMLKIKDRIKHNILPSAMGLFDVVCEQKEGKTIIKIIVASGSEKPYFKKKFGMTEKGCFIRLGTAAEPMPQRQIERLFSTRTRNSIGKIRANRQALSFEQLRIYYDEKKKTLNDQFPTNLELLTPEGEFNYVAYLLADENAVSVKVAKYSGSNRVDLIENNEYGYTSLIKATKSVLDKVNLENRTRAKITAKERIEQRLWNEVALREAIINAFVHNDYTREIAPTVEVFNDRIEITSAGALLTELGEEEFFKGFSIPRNKELMRVFRDVDLVEQLGSGIPRILAAYGRESFGFTENFLRMRFPASEPVYMDDEERTHQVNHQVTPQVTHQDTHQDTHQVTPQVEKLMAVMNGELYRVEIQNKLGLKDRVNFRKNYLIPALENGLIEMTIPDKPNSRNQKYRLTELGKALVDEKG